MSIIDEKDYIISIDMFNNPTEVNGTRAKALKIIRLILMHPGSDPLHPNMGVGLSNFRFSTAKGSDSGFNKLVKRTEDQINTYLPHLRIADVSYTMTVDHKLSIEIIINDEIFVYNTEYEPYYPSDISNM
jgi:hypothetical protein